MLLPVSLLCAHLLSAQAPLPQPAPTLSPTAHNTWNLAWTGILDRTYFLQCSPDLEQWIYLPNYIETGTGQAINYGLSSPNQQAFFRLAFSDITTSDADTADFDGDGIGNLLEINAGTDPLDLDTDDDGLTNAEEAALGTSMTNPDSDGDGITDGGEVEEGTDPNDDNDTPDAEWLTVTGDLAAGEVAARNRSLTIPAGESRLVIVAIASDEYPIFTSGTEENFEYNDVLTWEVKLDGDEVLSNRIDVNARNTQWDEALANGQTLRGFDPVHFEAVKLITAPADADGQVEIELSAMNVEDGTHPSTVVVGLLPVDLDIVHPATGELADGREASGDGGYISVKRMVDNGNGGENDVTPITKLKIHPIGGAQADWKTRLKFDSGGRYKIYKDEARTQLITSEATEFPADKATLLYFQGEEKSTSRGGEEITIQVGIEGEWHNGDSVKCTVVQSEFQIQLKAFIPYAWSEAEEEIPGPNGLNPLNGKVVQGDLHPIGSPNTNLRPAFPGFRNIYSDNSTTFFEEAPFRVMQTVVLTPYEELHNKSEEISERKAQTAPSSEHFNDSSVNAAESHLEMGFLRLSGAATDSGKPPLTSEKYEDAVRTGKVARIWVEARGKDGALGAVTGFADDIHWRIWLKVWADGNGATPLEPKVEFGGQHDSYPAYEIIVIQSDESFTHVHRRSPAVGAKPGPSSLNDNNAVNVSGIKTITD